MVWDHLAATSVNVAYAIVGIFAILFSLVSSPIKERLYIGEASVATIAGLIFGPFCLKWFIPTQWGSETITLQISRVVLCIQIFAVAVELPKKYMKKHWVSVFILLVPVMTVGWLIVGLFTWIIFKPLNFSQSLLISGCITATDPVLALAVVGKGKFAQKVPGHLRNLLSAESGCNDGMLFPFIFLLMNLILHAGNAGEIVKDWICVTILYECVFGCILGLIIGWLARRAITLAERFGTIDRESFLAFYVMLSFACAGLGSVLGVDELLVAFALGLAFSWNGQYAKKTEDAMVSTAIDLLLNLSYFVYLGALLPWNFYHQPDLGLPFWKYLLLALAVIFLRRIPLVLSLWRLTPDLNTWREALFAGHFGPIGVGAIYAVILARSEVEEDSTGHVTSLTQVPEPGVKNYHLILYLWPVVSFLVVASIVVHGSSVAVLVFGRRLRTMSISMTFTQTQGNANSQSWMSRLPRIDTNGRSFTKSRTQPLSQATTIETSGVPARPAGGAHRRRKFKHRRERPKTEKLDLNQMHRNRFNDEDEEEAVQVRKSESTSSSDVLGEKMEEKSDERGDDTTRVPTTAYQEGETVIVDDQEGEVMGVMDVESGDNGDSGLSGDNGAIGAATGAEISAKLGANLTAKTTDTSSHNSFELDSIGSGSKPHRRHRITPLAKVRSNAGADAGAHGSNSNSPYVSGSTRSGSTTKYIAYRVRDEIIIENHEGEILKRYRIHGFRDKDADQGELAQQTPTLRQRALSLVGFKPAPAKSREEILEEGGPAEPVLIPETDGLTHEENALLRTNDTKIQRKLQGLIGNDYPTRPKKVASVVVNEGHKSRVDVLKDLVSGPDPYDFGRESEESETGDESDSDSDNGDESGENGDSDDDLSQEESVEEETEIERTRRLNALGMGNTERNDEDEEEEIPTTTAKAGGMKLKWHSDV